LIPHPYRTASVDASDKAGVIATRWAGLM
jgi:hypothetical protein